MSESCACHTTNMQRSSSRLNSRTCLCTNAVDRHSFILSLFHVLSLQGRVAQAVREGRAVDLRALRHVDQEGQGGEAVRPHPLLGQVRARLELSRHSPENDASTLYDLTSRMGEL